MRKEGERSGGCKGDARPFTNEQMQAVYLASALRKGSSTATYTLRSWHLTLSSNANTINNSVDVVGINNFNIKLSPIHETFSLKEISIWRCNFSGREKLYRTNRNIKTIGVSHIFLFFFFPIKTWKNVNRVRESVRSCVCNVGTYRRKLLIRARTIPYTGAATALRPWNYGYRNLTRGSRGTIVEPAAGKNMNGERIYAREDARATRRRAFQRGTRARNFARILPGPRARGRRHCRL